MADSSILANRFETLLRAQRCQVFTTVLRAQLCLSAFWMMLKAQLCELFPALQKVQLRQTALGFVQSSTLSKCLTIAVSLNPSELSQIHRFVTLQSLVAA